MLQPLMVEPPVMQTDPNVIMLDQLARVGIMTALESVIQALIFGLIFYIILRLNDRRN